MVARATATSLLLALLAIIGAAQWACDDSPPVDGGPDVGADAEADGPPPECERDQDCDDLLECTSEYCQSGRCRRSTDPSSCDDGVQCNGAEVCELEVGCAPGEPLVCDDDGIACTVERCDGELDRCLSEPDNSLCPGGHLCDRGAGGCVPNG